MWLKPSAAESLILSSACFCDVCCIYVCVCVCLLSLQWPCSKWMSACLSPSMGPNAADRYFIRPGLSCVHATLKLFLNYPSIKALDGATDHAILRIARPNKATSHPSLPFPHHPQPPSIRCKSAQIYMHTYSLTCLHSSLHVFMHACVLSFYHFISYTQIHSTLRLPWK